MENFSFTCSKIVKNALFELSALCCFHGDITCRSSTEGETETEEKRNLLFLPSMLPLSLSLWQPVFTVTYMYKSLN